MWNDHFLLAYFIGVQEQMGRPSLKPIQEVETCWNSTYRMLQHLYDLREPLEAVLEGPPTDIAPLTTKQYDIIAESLILLSKFNDATIKLSEEKRVLGSKVIPLLSMLHHSGWESEAIKGETSCHWHHCSIWGLRRWATLAPIKLQMQRRGSLSNVQLLSETAQPHT